MASPLDSAPQKLSPADAHSLPTWRAAYSDRTSWMMARLSQYAYIPFADVQPHPGAGNPKMFRTADGWAALDPYLAPGGFEVRATFNAGDVQTFLAVNKDELAVLSFRGTANFGDWKINLCAGRMPMPGFEAVEVHTGFWEAFEGQAADIKEAVDKHVSPDLGLYITGHSLGGALAQIASAVLERDNLAACYTFGSPRVATQNFDTCVKCPHYRVVNHWDLVPGVPLAAPWGYQHTGDPRLLTGSKPTEALRHDHHEAERLFVDLWSLALWTVTHDFSAIDDHMIWNYRDFLHDIEEARGRDGEARPGTEAHPAADPV
jgi:triacylglycerol lipase